MTESEAPGHTERQRRKKESGNMFVFYIKEWWQGKEGGRDGRRWDIIVHLRCSWEGDHTKPSSDDRAI